MKKTIKTKRIEKESLAGSLKKYMKKKEKIIIQQGAEAIISLNKKGNVEKHRVKKSYRFPLLDNKIRKQRTKKESKILEKAAKLIPVPKLVFTDEKENIELEFIKG